MSLFLRRFWLMSLLLLSTPLLGSTFTSPAGSPLANGEHPRLFITKQTLGQLRNKIATYYHSDFQKFVDFMDRLYTTSPGSGDLGEWNEIFGAARSYALLYLVDPATISGIRATHSKTDYGRKAIDLALHISRKLPGSWNEPHHGAKTLTTSDGGLATLALQVVYDWTHDLTTLDERRAMADRLIILWDNKYDNDKVKLENHYAANTHAYGGALCFYGDTDLGSSYMAKAQIMMDSFQDVFVDRQLGVAELLFEGSSDWIEGDTYSMDAFIGIGILAAAAGPALGVNYFAGNSWLREAALYLYYNLVPMPYKGTYYYTQHNTSSVLTSEDSNPSQLMNIVASQLAESDPDLAGFAAWFCEQSPYGRDVDAYKYYDPHLFDFFYKFIFGTKHIPKKSPEQAIIPLSKQLGQAHVMRSDHSVGDATLIQFYAHQYWYPNGHNEPEFGAINIHRFGPLAVPASNTKNSGDGIPRVKSDGKGMAMNNVFGMGDDPRLDVEMPSIRPENADHPDDFAPGSLPHIGHVEARESWENEWDYINYNYTRSYSAGTKTELARRALVYLRGPVNSEYLVVMDRVKSDRQKYFLLHTPVDIEALDGNWRANGRGHWVMDGRAVSVTNRIDRAHGRMFVYSVFPATVELHKFGGPGYEWVWADGTPLDYSASDFSELASYLFGDHTLQIRSSDDFFLTAIKIGDANTLPELVVEKLEGDNWAGALLDKTRLVVFSKTETPLQDFSYTIESDKWVKHLIFEVDRRRVFTVLKDGKTVTSGSTASTGRIFFYDLPGGRATYTIRLGESTAVEENGSTLPEAFALSNYPNPFYSGTSGGMVIRFELPQAQPVELAIYNTAGQRVRTLIHSKLTAGAHTVRWNGRSAGGAPLASGLYFYRLRVNGRVAAQQKLLLLR